MRTLSIMAALVVVGALGQAPSAAQAKPPDPALFQAQRAIQRGRVADAVKHLLPLAHKGHFGAQLSLAQLFELPGATRDLSKSLHWYTQAAGQGSPDAMEAVGLAFYLGRGTAADAAQAAEWFRQAGDRGSVTAQYILATQFEKGDGVPQDLRLARAWYDRAARLGDAAAALRRDAIDQQAPPPTTPP